MKQGISLQQLAAEVSERSRRKDDLVMSTAQMVMFNGSELSLPTDGETGIGAQRAELPLERIAHRQIGERLGLPAKFCDSLREATKPDGRGGPSLRRWAGRCSPSRLASGRR